jgi:hypothetical protein
VMFPLVSGNCDVTGFGGGQIAGIVVSGNS